MAFIRQKLITKTVDFLGTTDECYQLQGDTHKHLAQRFLSEVTGAHHKQLFFFSGEKGMGKTRLAKQTARELAKLVNEDGNNPVLFLFFINCERLRGPQGADASQIQLQISQKVAAVDEKLSSVLANSDIDDFATKLSTGLQNKVFLFLMDGIDPTSDNVMSLLESLIHCNDNVLILTTSCVRFNLLRLAPKVWTYTCTGLQEDAAIALLRDVAGKVDDLSEYQQDLVSHCHFNPLLIMIIGQEMNKDTCCTLNTAKDMQDLFKHSFSMAVGCNNVPEKDNILGTIQKLAENISKSIGKNLVSVIDEPPCFTAEHLASKVLKGNAAVVTRAYLQPLTKYSILKQEDGFFSVSEIFKKYFEGQRVLLNQSQDEFIEKVYKELQTTLRISLSKEGMIHMIMIHQDDMDKITKLEKRIAGVREPTSTLKYAYQVQLILACEAFLQNIPLGASQVSEFNEKVCVILNRFRAQHHKTFQDGWELRATQEFKELSVTKKDDKKQTPQRREQDDLTNAIPRPALHDRPPRNEKSLRDRFGFMEVSTSQLSSFSNFSQHNYSSLMSADDVQEVGEPATKPVSDPCNPHPRYCNNLLQKQPSFQPSQPQEVSYNGDGLTFLLPCETQPEEQSFHDWQSSAPGATCTWSMDVNPPSPNSRNT